MNRLALSAVLACATMACASTQTAVPPAASAGAAKPAPESGAVIASDGEAVGAKVHEQPWLGAAAASRFVMADGHEQFVGVWIDVPKARALEHVPAAVSLTIDTSGSMAGEKIEHAREAARTVVQQLHDGDIVSIHEFNTSARELVPPMVVDAHSRAQIHKVLGVLRADGSTNIEEGLGIAINRARMAPSSHPVRRVLLISDGRATVGSTSAHVLGRIAEQATPFGVQVTSLGVGLDYDENTLNELAVRSSGRLYHLADSREMAGIIEAELSLLQSTVGTDAFVEIVPAPGVQLAGAAGVRSEWAGGGTLRVPLGSMFAGQRRELLVRFRLVDEQVEGSRPIVSARLLYRDPADGGVQRVQETVVRAERTMDMALVREHENPDVQAIVAMSRAAEVAANAREQVASGRFDDAEVALARAEAQLRQKAKDASSERDRHRMLQAAKKVNVSRRAVGSAKAAPPAARPAASRASSLMLNDTAMEARGY